MKVKKSKKILLIQAPLDNNNPAGSPVIPPLAILSLANYLKEKSPGLEVKIMDGQLFGLKIIADNMKLYQPDIVGISFTIRAYENALILARVAKSLNAQVVLGGHAATFSAGEILKNRGSCSKDYCVDAVCRQDGEKALLSLTRGLPYSRIPNLAWMDGNDLRFNKIAVCNLNELPFLDFNGLVNLDDYFKTTQEPSGSCRSGVIVAYSRKGCAWRAKTGGCIFCAVAHPGIQLKSPARYYKEVVYLQERYKPRLIREASDDFLDDRDWLQKFRCLIRKRNKQDIKLWIFARAERINKEIIPCLKDINVAAINFGFESIDDRMLAYMRKGNSGNDIRRAVDLLTDANIEIMGNFIFGGPKETKKTLKANLNAIRTFKKINPSMTIISHRFMILPGSPAWKMLIRKTGKKYLNQDNPDLEEMDRDWLKYFTRVTPQDVSLAMKEAAPFSKKI